MQNGFRIANLRVLNNISQEEMARILKSGLTLYKKYELNETCIRLEYLNLIANMFDVSLDYLLGLTDNQEIKLKIDNEIDYKYLKFSLRYQRRIRRINQTDLAKAFNISPQTIITYENNAYNMPVSYLIEFAKKFKISVDYICGKSLQKEIA